MLINIIKRPLLSKKSQINYEKDKTYTFIVEVKANKFQIKLALKEIFKVEVAKIRTILNKSYPNSSYQFKYPGKKGKKLTKKALVVLKEGFELPLFKNKD